VGVNLKTIGIAAVTHNPSETMKSTPFDKLTLLVLFELRQARRICSHFE